MSISQFFEKYVHIFKSVYQEILRYNFNTKLTKSRALWKKLFNNLNFVFQILETKYKINMVYGKFINYK